MSNLSNDYDVRLATLKKLGGDMSKKYATIYDVDLAILEKIGQGGGGEGGDVDLKTFGGKSLKGQGEFLEDFATIPNTGEILGVTGEIYSPTRGELLESLPSEFQSAYSYKFIKIYGNNVWGIPHPSYFGLYVKKTQEDVGTLLIYDEYMTDNPIQTIVCQVDLTDMKVYQNGVSNTIFYNSNIVWVLVYNGSDFIFSGVDDSSPIRSLAQWLYSHNVHKQILTAENTIISDDSGNLYKMQEVGSEFTEPQPISFTHYPDGLSCDTDNMYVMYDSNIIIYNNTNTGEMFYCNNDSVEEFAQIVVFGEFDTTPKIYQYFEHKISEDSISFNNYLVSPNNGLYYYIELRSEGENQIYELHSKHSPYALSGIDLSAEVNGYMNVDNALILCDGLNFRKLLISDTLTDYRLGFVYQDPGVDELRANQIAEEKATEKINEFKNSGYIQTIATEKINEFKNSGYIENIADSKVDNALYNITTESTSFNTKDYLGSQIYPQILSASIPYSDPDNKVTLYADFTNCVYPSDRTDNNNHSLHRVRYNNQRVFEISLYRKEDGDIAPSVKILGNVTDYFAPDSFIDITDESGTLFEITEINEPKSYKFEEIGLTGKKMWIRYQINSNISVTSLDFEYQEGNMETYAGGVNNFNLFYEKETVHKNNKFAPVSSVKPYMGSMPDSLPSEAGDWVLVYNPESGFRFELKSK